MTFELPIAPIRPDDQQWKRIRRVIHAWRGAMIDHFALAEMSVGEALLILGGPPTKEHALHLVGRKLDRLEQLIEKEGPHAAVGGQVRKSLKDYREYDELRPILCHGRLTPAIDEAGWVAILKAIHFHSSTAATVEKVVTEAQAQALLAALESAVKHLTGQLRAMLKNVSKS